MGQFRLYQLNMLVLYIISVVLLSKTGVASEFEIRTGAWGKGESAFVIQKLNDACHEIKFSVKSPSNARIALLVSVADIEGIVELQNQTLIGNLKEKKPKSVRDQWHVPSYAEIEIGASSNTKISLKIDNKIEADVTVNQVLSKEEYRNFSVRFNEKLIKVGRANQTLLVWEDNKNKMFSMDSKIAFIGFSTASNTAAGSWILSSQDFNTTSLADETKNAKLTELKSGDWRFLQKKAAIRKLKKPVKDRKKVTMAVKTGGVAHVFLLTDQILEDIENYHIPTVTLTDQSNATKLIATNASDVERVRNNLKTWPKRYIEIVIGEVNKNKEKEIIVRGGYQHEWWDYKQLPRDILSSEEHRYFWVQYDDTSVKMNFIVTHIGFSTSSGSGSWLLPDDSYEDYAKQPIPDIDSHVIDSCQYQPTYRNPGYWANADVFEDVPLTAQPVYEIKDGFNFFIGRIEYSGAISPGIVRWGQGISYTTARNERIEKLGYQIFIRNAHFNYTWVAVENAKSVPSGALQAGVSDSKEFLPVFICRYKGSHVYIGVLFPDGRCRLPSDKNITIVRQSYELLVVKTIPLSINSNPMEKKNIDKINQCQYKPIYRHPVVWRDWKIVNGLLPLKAASAGIGVNKEKVYICRAWLNVNEILQIGTLSPSREKPCSLINTKRKPVTADNYQVLVRDKHTKLKWESVTNQLPNGVIQGGISAQKKPLFICRCSVKNVYKVGSVEGRGVCAIYYDDEVIECMTYQVLVASSVSFWDTPEKLLGGTNTSRND